MLRASRTSAEPERELTDRLPHLMTRQPPAATMREAPVEMLMVLAPSPPVPAVSRTPVPVIGKGLAALRKARAAGFEGGEEGGDVDVGVVAVGEGFESGLGFVGGGVGVGEVGDEVVDEVHDAGPFRFR